MIRFSYSLCAILCILFAASCLKSTESTDRTKPVINYIWFNRNDTLKFVNNGDTTIIRFNESKSNVESLVTSRKDTLVTGKILALLGKISDNEEISSYKIEIYNDPSGSNVIKPIIKGWMAYRQDESKEPVKEFLIDRKDFFVPDSVPSKMKPSTNLSLEQGDYKLKFVAMDRSSNRDSITFDVKILSRDSLYQIKKLSTP